MGRSRLNAHRPLLRQLGLLLALPVVVMSSSFALFTQELSVDATTSSVAYVSNQYTTMTYTKTTALAGSTYTYTINPMTIKNDGVTAITAWKVTFKVPADVTAITCPTTITCSLNTATDIVTLSDTVTVAAGATNVVSSGTSPIKFSTTTAAYTLQDVNISATFATTYVALSGLTVVATAGPKSGGAFPLTVTITNNTGQPISGWQVTVPTTKKGTSTVPSGVSYTSTVTLLTYTGAAVSIADGDQYTFNTSVTSTMTTWVTTGAAVKGKA